MMTPCYDAKCLFRCELHPLIFWFSPNGGNLLFYRLLPPSVPASVRFFSAFIPSAHLRSEGFCSEFVNMVLCQSLLYSGIQDYQ